MGRVSVWGAGAALTAFAVWAVWLALSVREHRAAVHYNVRYLSAAQHLLTGNGGRPGTADDAIAELARTAAARRPGPAATAVAAAAAAPGDREALGAAISAVRGENSQASTILGHRLDALYLVVAASLGLAVAVLALLARAGRLSQRLALELAERREVERTVRTMAAAVAHEIRNPLCYIIFNMNHLARQLRALPGVDPGKIAELEGVTLQALDGADRVARLTRDFSDLGRPPAAELSSVDVNSLVERTLQLVGAAQQGRVRVVPRYGQEARVRVDPTRLGQVLLNLVRNAAESVPAGDERCRDVEVSTRQRDGHVFVEVADHGSGIPEDARARLFEPFFTTKPDGTGLGLWVSKRIVESYGGSLTFETGPGGTTFTVVLPHEPAAAPV